MEKNNKSEKCVFKQKCRGNKQNGKYSSFPLYDDQKESNKCCRKCLRIVIEARYKYIDKHNCQVSEQ